MLKPSLLGCITPLPEGSRCAEAPSLGAQCMPTKVLFAPLGFEAQGLPFGWLCPHMLVIRDMFPTDTVFLCAA